MGAIKVDLALCQGHGRCYGVAPQLFSPIDDDGHAAYVGGDIERGDAAGDIAIGSCPEQALSWDDAAAPSPAVAGGNDRERP